MANEKRDLCISFYILMILTYTFYVVLLVTILDEEELPIAFWVFCFIGILYCHFSAIGIHKLQVDDIIDSSEILKKWFNVWTAFVWWCPWIFPNMIKGLTNVVEFCRDLEKHCWLVIAVIRIILFLSFWITFGGVVETPLQISCMVIWSILLFFVYGSSSETIIMIWVIIYLFAVIIVFIFLVIVCIPCVIISLSNEQREQQARNRRQNGKIPSLGQLSVLVFMT